MLSDWLSEDGRKAIEKMGWPEWQHEHDAESLQRLVLIEIGDGTCGWSFDKIFTIDRRRYIRNEECPARAALCLLRDHAREWLAEQDVGIDWGCGVWWIHTKPPTCEYHDDYDSALIAAILAQKEAGHEQTSNQACRTSNQVCRPS